jgi:hypothetical protein
MLPELRGRVLPVIVKAGTTKNNLCPKGLNRNDHGAAFQAKGTTLKVPLSGTFRVVPWGEAFSEQTTTFRSFRTVS